VFHAEIDTELCDGCQDCIDLCYFDAIDMVRAPKQKRMKAMVDPDVCCGCGLCSPSCPQQGIEMKPIGEDDLPAPEPESRVLSAAAV
jgi:ferredoxin